MAGAPGGRAGQLPGVRQGRAGPRAAGRGGGGGGRHGAGGPGRRGPTWRAGGPGRAPEGGVRGCEAVKGEREGAEGAVFGASAPQPACSAVTPQPPAGAAAFLEDSSWKTLPGRHSPPSGQGWGQRPDCHPVSFLFPGMCIEGDTRLGYKATHAFPRDCRLQHWLVRWQVKRHPAAASLAAEGDVCGSWHICPSSYSGLHQDNRVSEGCH